MSPPVTFIQCLGGQAPCVSGCLRSTGNIRVSRTSIPVQTDSGALIAIGGNWPPDPGHIVETIVSTICDIDQEIGRIVSVSRFYKTPAFPEGAGPDFVNAAMRVDTILDVRDCLERLHGIEARYGRERQNRWGARTLDLDLLALGQAVHPDPITQSEWRNMGFERQTHEAPDQLILPHPRLQDRAFVLIPLADIAPDWPHPLTKETVASMLSALPESEKAAICPL
ncbi:MAG: 2-amino-4-hydroxy-6-hydroxymethyldihydropteridine diphosphokinase [Albidovulum sp.]